MPVVTQMPPRGHYLAREAGRLAGVSGDRIGQWARRGYIRSSQRSTSPRVYSYQDVAEAMVVHELLLHEVPLKSIRRTVEFLRTTYGDWPLTSVELSVLDGPGPHRQVFVTDTDGIWDAARSGQGYMGPIDLQRIAGYLQRGGWAARDIPDLEHIEVDPDRLSGRPTIRGRRIPADEVAVIAQRPDGEKVLRVDYGLSTREIRDARRWWSAVERYEQAA